MEKKIRKELDIYITEKISLLHQFDIYLSHEEKEKLYELTSEIAIDNFCHSLFINKLEDK